jgi:4-amino-4-deoxychorismate lyase
MNSTIKSIFHKGDNINTLFFETIKCLDSSVYNLDYHKKRISNTIGKNFPLEEYIYPPTNELLRCKIVYNYDEIISINYFPYNKKVIHSFLLTCADDIKYDKKYFDRSCINTLIKNNKNMDDIIVIKNGILTDTSIANIAYKINEIWYTPKTPLLNGTTRQRYLDNGIIHEKDIGINDIHKIEEFAILNAMLDFEIIDNFILKKDNK